MYLNTMITTMSVIARPKLSGGGEHWGVRFGNLVAHMTEERGPHLVTYEEFAAGRQVREVRKVAPSQHKATIERIRAEISRPTKYHLLDNNCEIFANRVTGCAPQSSQVGWGIVLGILGITALVAAAG